jgi:hypothetical protein
VCSETEICLSIVEAVSIDMVDEHALRGLKHSAVHRKVSFSYAIYSGPSSGIESSAVRIGVPIVFRKSIVIIGIDDGELSPSERDSPEGAAVAEEAVEKHRQRQDIIQPVRDFDF